MTRRVLIQFAGILRNASGHKQPGVVIAKGVGPVKFDEVLVLFDPRDESKEVAENLINRLAKGDQRLHRVTLDLSAPYGIETVRRQCEEVFSASSRELFAITAGARRAQATRRYNLAKTHFYLSTITGTKEAAVALYERFEALGVTASLVSEGASSRDFVVHPISTWSPDATVSPFGRLRSFRHLPLGSIVLLTGPSGSGKTKLAEDLHRMWTSDALVTLNCATIPESLAESKLFGHERGAFTGAAELHRGIFERADGGTVFLDEFGELTPNVQAKLLTVLDQYDGARTLTRLGGDRAIRFKVRIILATNRDLSDLRQDLLWRTTSFHVRVPPLAERRHAIMGAYLRHLASLATQYGVARFALDRSAYRRLEFLAYDPEVSWSKNFRDIVQSAERLALAAYTEAVERAATSASSSRGDPKTGDGGTRIGPPTGTITIRDGESIHREIARLTEGPPNPSRWPRITRKYGAARVQGLAELDRWRGEYLLQAQQATDSGADAGRYLRDHNLIGAGPRAKNPSSAFKKQLDAFNKLVNGPQTT